MNKIISLNYSNVANVLKYRRLGNYALSMLDKSDIPNIAKLVDTVPFLHNMTIERGLGGIGIDE
jgi:hypothetical protein